MADKGIEAKVARYPQQHVREGRGVPGYTGKVQVYDTAKPASLRAQRAQANKAGDIPPSDRTQPVDPTQPEKLEAGKLTRDQLESIGAGKGLTAEEMAGFQTKQELVDAIEAR